MFTINIPRIDVHVHEAPDLSAAEKLDRILTGLSELKTQGAQHMTRSDEVLAIVGRLDGATNELANDLRDLRDKIAAGTIGDAELAQLDRVTTALEALGRDPENPVPEPAPAPPTA